jgi:hypothetical protein
MGAFAGNGEAWKIRNAPVSLTAPSGETIRAEGALDGFNSA